MDFVEELSMALLEWICVAIAAVFAIRVWLLINAAHWYMGSRLKMAFDAEARRKGWND